MTGFEPRTSGIRSDRSTNWATTTAPFFPFLVMCLATTTIRLGDFWRSLKVTNFLSKLDQMHCDFLGYRQFTSQYVYIFEERLLCLISNLISYFW